MQSTVESLEKPSPLLTKGTLKVNIIFIISQLFQRDYLVYLNSYLVFKDPFTWYSSGLLLQIDNFPVYNLNSKTSPYCYEVYKL